MIKGNPRVLNRYKDVIPPDAIYIGRPSKWGNPFTIEDYGDRLTCVIKYRKWLDGEIKLDNINPPTKEEIRKELAGKDLVCSCAPDCCHGDVLLEIANDW